MSLHKYESRLILLAYTNIYKFGELKIQNYEPFMSIGKCESTLSFKFCALSNKRPQESSINWRDNAHPTMAGFIELYAEWES
jgi:hypothetical protein